MRFFPAMPDKNYFTRFVSGEGRWELGLIHRTFGRVSVGFSPAGRKWTTKSYCCGSDRKLVQSVLAAVLAILERYPETVTEEELFKIFPDWTVRPINRDPCYEKLLALAGMSEKGKVKS